MRILLCTFLETLELVVPKDQEAGGQVAEGHAVGEGPVCAPAFPVQTAVP